MRDAGQCDQLCVHTGLLKLRNSRRRWVKRCDLVVARVNCQNRKPPPGGRCRRPAGNWNRRAEAFREFLCQMPGASASHAVARDCNLFLVDCVVGDDEVEQCVHGLLVFPATPIAANRIRRDDNGSPVLIDEHGVLLAGHGRLDAARLLGLKTIPAIVIDGLSEARKRALLLADNRIAQSAGWDRERLASELISLPDLLADDGLDISVTGFEPAEIDALAADFADDAADPADTLDPRQRLPAPR